MRRLVRSRGLSSQRLLESKMEDLNANDIDSAVEMIAGTARSMGVTVEG